MQMRNHTFTGRIRNRGITLYFFYLIPIWLFILSLTLNAQTASIRPTTSGPKMPPAQVMMTGTIRQLTTAQITGAQLVVDGTKGEFTANLGSNLSRELQKSLSSGKSVQVTGTMQIVDGQQSMTAYAVTIDGKQITIRNPNGFLAHTSSRARNTSTSGALYGGSK